MIYLFIYLLWVKFIDTYHEIKFMDILIRFLTRPFVVDFPLFPLNGEFFYESHVCSFFWVTYILIVVFPLLYLNLLFSKAFNFSMEICLLPLFLNNYFQCLGCVKMLWSLSWGIRTLHDCHTLTLNRKEMDLVLDISKDVFS